MNSLKLFTGSACRLSTSSKEPSVVPWISPLHYIRARSPKPDPPTEPLAEAPKRSKYISHESAIMLIKREKDPQHVLKIFNMVATQRGFSHNHSTYAVTLHKLGRLKKFADVDSVLHQMSYETCKFHESIFLDLMTHFSKSSLHKRVVEMFNAIQPIVREKPSLKAVSTCLNLLVDSNQVDLARSFLLHAKKTFDLHPNTCIFNILVKHHCRNGNLESAFEVVKEMKMSELSYPNLITYSTIMEGLCEKGQLEEAINLFEEMVSKDKVVPDVLTYNILINGFCRGGKVDRAIKIIDFMKKNGCNPNIFNYSTLMNGFCKEGNLQEAKRVFNEMKGVGLHPDKVGYTTLINCLCRAGEVDEAIRFLKQMEVQACKGDTITYNIILVGLCRYDRTYEALEMLQKLPYEGVYLDKSSYRIATIRYKSVERLKQVGKHSLLGASGEISDFQEILRYLDQLILNDNMWDDGNSLGPKELHNYLTRIMYNRRNKFDPLWNSLVIGGVKNGQKYLGSVSMIGVHYEDDHLATGFGNHLARPILREEWREDLTFEEGVKLLEKCMRNLLYRDRSAVNKLQIANITEEGLTISQPYSLKTFWNYAAFQNPTVGAEGSW